MIWNRPHQDLREQKLFHVEINNIIEMIRNKSDSTLTETNLLKNCTNYKEDKTKSAEYERILPIVYFCEYLPTFCIY